MDNTQIESSAEQIPLVKSLSPQPSDPGQTEQKLEQYENIFEQQQEQIDFLTTELERLKYSALL